MRKFHVDNTKIVADVRVEIVNMLTELVESMEVVCMQDVFARLSPQEVQDAVTLWYELAYTSLQSLQELLRYAAFYRSSRPQYVGEPATEQALRSSVPGPAFVRSTGRQRIAASESGLTAREYELTLLLARSMPLKEIARQWGVCEKTVRNHLASVYRKLHCQDRVQVVLYALRAGWFEL